MKTIPKEVSEYMSNLGKLRHKKNPFSSAHMRKLALLRHKKTKKLSPDKVA